MVAKRYTLAGILGVTALIGTCSNGFADMDRTCTATCSANYSRESNSCPSLNSDAHAYFLCLIKAQDKQEACDWACVSRTIGANSNRDANANPNAKAK